LMRTALLRLGCALALAGCSQQVAGEPRPTSFVDTLPLSLTAVQEISGFDGLRREIDTDQPAPDTYLPEGPCHEMADQQIAFGDSWTHFRSVADTGDLEPADRLSPIVSVAQNLVAYTDDSTARKAFDHHVLSMTDCAAQNMLGLEGAIVRPDGATAVWVNGGMAIVFVIETSILIQSMVVALPYAERVATEFPRAILDRIA